MSRGDPDPPSGAERRAKRRREATSAVRARLPPPNFIIRKPFKNVFLMPIGPSNSITVIDRLNDSYRNPVSLAIEWKKALKDGKYATQRALAQDVGVHRTSVAKTLSLLDLDKDVIRAVEFLGDPLPGPLVTVAGLHDLVNLSPNDQKRKLKEHLRGKGITILGL